MASAMLSVRSPFVSSTRALAPRPRISAARAPVVQRRSFVVRAVRHSFIDSIHIYIEELAIRVPQVPLRNYIQTHPLL